MNYFTLTEMSGEAIFESYRIFCFTFPNNNYFPSFFSKLFFYNLITFNIFAEFLLPELYPALWCICIFAPWMSVPETAVNQNDRFVFR